ncbi:MAG: hypothetical protein AAB728_01170, partial [Patescibacteria group bacterium]
TLFPSSSFALGSAGRITGAGTLDNYEPGAGGGLLSLPSTATLDVANFSITNPVAGAVYAPGTYRSAGVLVRGPEAAASTLTLSNGAYVFTGNLTVQPNGADKPITVANATNNPNIQIQGNLNIVEAQGPVTWTKGTGTLTLSGSTATQAVGPQGKSLEALVINKAHGTVQFTGTGTFTGLTVSSGTVDFNGKAITITGDWNTGIQGQVNPVGLPGSVITVGGNLSLTGEENDKLNLAAAGSWTLTVAGSASASHVNVAYSDASGGNTVIASAGTNGGGNLNWSFGRSVTGKLTSDEGVTPLSGRTVAVSVNGAAVSGSDATDAAGGFTVHSTAVMTGGSILTLFADDEAEDAVTVVLGSGSNMTGVSLYQNRLIVRSESGSVAVTNAHLGVGAANGDSDISALYSVASGNLTVASSKELLVWTGDTFTPGGTVTATDIDVNGTLNMGANAYTISGNFDIAANAFSATGTGTFTATAAGKSITATGSSLGKVVLNGTGGGWTLMSNLVMSSATLTAGTLTDNGKTVRVDGSIGIANTASLLTSTGIWEMSANGDVSNPQSGNLFGTFQIDSSVTAAKTGAVLTKKLIMGTNAVLSAWGGTLGLFPTADDFIDMAAGASITGAQVSITMPSGTTFSQKAWNTTTTAVIALPWGSSSATLRMTGNWTTASLLIYGSNVSTTEATAMVLDTNGYNLKVNGYLRFGAGSSNFKGKIELKNGTHRITGNIYTNNSDTHGYIDLGSGTVLAGGDIDLRYATVRKQQSHVVLNGSTTQYVDSGTGAAVSVFHTLTHSGASTVTVSGSNLQIGSGLTLKSTAGTFNMNGKNFTGSGLTVNGGTLTGGAGNVDVNGNVTIGGGTLTAPTGTFTVSGNWAKTGGTFTHS